jgi:hypothetical protein
MYFKTNDKIKIGIKNSNNNSKLENDHLIAIQLEKITFHTDKFNDCGNLEKDKEGIYQLNFCNQKTIMTFDGNGDVIMKGCNRIVYLGKKPTDLNIEYNILESDEKFRDVLGNANKFLDKLAPIAAGANPGAGAGTAALSSLIKHIKMGVDDDEMDSVRIFKENVEFYDNSIITISRDKMVSQCFKVIDLGKIENKKSKNTGCKYSIRIKSLNLTGEFEDSNIKKIFNRIVSRDNMYFCFDATSRKMKNSYSAQFRKIITWKEYEIFQTKSNNTTKENIQRIIPMSLNFSLNRKGINATHLFDLIVGGASSVNKDIEIFGQTVNPAELAEKMQKEEDSILKFITKNTDDSILLHAFNGAFVLCEGKAIPDSEETVVYFPQKEDKHWEQTFYANLGEKLSDEETFDKEFFKRVFSKAKTRFKKSSQANGKEFSFKVIIKEI